MPSVVLTIQHTLVCPPARVGDWLTAAGCVLDIRHPYDHVPLPDSLDGFAGLLVLGGEMGAYDDDRHPWLGPTKRLLSEAVRRQVPTLAICLGHQLLAVAAGGAVAPAPAGPQVGLRTVVPAGPGRDYPLFAALGPDWRPSGWAGRSGGVQFHPEVTHAILRSWGAADVLAGLLTAEQVKNRLAEVQSADVDLVQAWSAFTERFAAVVRGAEATRR